MKDFFFVSKLSSIKCNVLTITVCAEPNLLSHTTHSVSKKGIRKRDLNDTELRDILLDLMPHIRPDHILPPNSDILSSAIKRGLLSTPPSHMMGDEGANPTSSAWIRGKNNGMFVKPRLFSPYYEECKVSNTVLNA